MPPYPSSPPPSSLPLRDSVPPVLRTMLPTTNRRQPPSSLNLSTALAKRVSRSFDKFPPPATLPPVVMPMMRPNAGKEWVEGMLKVKDFGLARDRGISRAKSLPLERVTHRYESFDRGPRSLELSENSTSIRLSTESLSLYKTPGKLPPSFQHVAPQPTVEDVAVGTIGLASSKRPVCTSASKVKSRVLSKSTTSSIAKSKSSMLGDPPNIKRTTSNNRSSMDFVWTSQTTPATIMTNPSDTEVRRTHQYGYSTDPHSQLSVVLEAFHGDIQLLMSSDVEALVGDIDVDETHTSNCSEERGVDPNNAALSMHVPCDVLHSRSSSPPLSSAAASIGSVYSRPSALPTLQSTAWSSHQAGAAATTTYGLLSALPTGFASATTKPVVGLTPFLVGTPLKAAVESQVEESAETKPTLDHRPDLLSLPSSNVGTTEAGSGCTESEHKPSNKIMTSVNPSAHSLTENTSDSEAIVGCNSPAVEDTTVDNVDALTPSTPRSEEHSAIEELQPPKRPSPVAFHPCGQFSHRIAARSTLPSKVTVPKPDGDQEIDGDTTEDIEIDPGQPWTWNPNHTTLDSSNAAKRSANKRPGGFGFEPPPTYSRRRSWVAASQTILSQPGARTLLAAPKSTLEPLASSSSLLGPRGRRLSIVLPPASSVSKKMVAVQVVGK